jgi:uncharacterized protein with HEPN domain
LIAALYNETIVNHSLTLEKVKSDAVFKNSLAMDILQIGELVNVLSDDFKAANSDMPWREIKRMRDKAEHHYGAFVATIATNATSIPLV